MAELVIRLKKNSDGSASLTCTRADGSVTWQRQNGKLGHVFPLHDLTHFAVETTLGYDNAFFGLIADGWDIADFASPWPRGEPPKEAREVESVVSGFDMDRSQGVAKDAAEFNARLAAFIESSAAASRKNVAPRRELTAEEIDSIRSRRDALAKQWIALPLGEAMEIEFDRRTSLK